MPLAATAISMNEKVEAITASLPQSSDELQSWNSAEKWGDVAEAFFAGSVIPAWTPVGLAAGKAAWIATALGVMDSPQSMSAAAMELGFTAFAALAAVPGNVLPATPVVHAPPAGNPNLSPLASLPPSESTMPSTSALHSILLAWAITGTQTTPGAPPVVLPWS
tara:strand:- start:3471 stop:3962 length:492 start_codon:yes stop_codon:yes gene_type:complete